MTTYWYKTNEYVIIKYIFLKNNLTTYRLKWLISTYKIYIS